MFEVKDLRKQYGSKVVVNDLSFKLEKPGVYALLGTNGAGKTTSIRMILGMLAKDGGTVTWNGKEFDTSTMNVGYLAEERGLYPKYSLLDQLLYFASLKRVPKADAMDRIKHWAKKLEVEEYIFPPKTAKGKKAKANRADQLSKGNQQKIQLMAALISDPEFIILDEPLSGLDPVNTELFKGIIREEIAKEKYLIMSSHQMDVIEEFCSDITILNRGNVVLQGDLNEIKKGYGRVNLFLKSDSDLDGYVTESGIQVVEKTPQGYQLKVKNEEEARAFLTKLINANEPIIRFELREPSLHEIFIEKVGNTNE